MPTRHINNVRETATEVSFDLVIRDEANAYTYGGGRVTVNKAALLTKALLELAIYTAVEKIIVEGNDAYPKTRPEDGPEPPEFVRRFHAYASSRNLRDRPGRLDPSGSR